MAKETVTISMDEYLELLAASKQLNVLHQIGVDNWEGYQEAMDLLESIEE